MKTSLKFKVIRKLTAIRNPAWARIVLSNQLSSTKNKEEFKWLISLFRLSVSHSLVKTQISWSDPSFWEARADCPIEISRLDWWQNKQTKSSACICMVLTRKAGVVVCRSSLILSTSHSCISSRRQNLEVSTQQIYILIPHTDLTNLRFKQLKDRKKKQSQTLVV